MRSLRIRDVMTSPVVVAGEDAPLKQVVRMLQRHRISAVPVVDARERVVGIITEADLLAVEEEPIRPSRHRRSILWFMHPRRLARLSGGVARAPDLRARDVMSRGVITIELDIGVREAAAAMLDAGVKRLVIVDEEGRAVGIVSRIDLLRPFLRPDTEIAAEIREVVIPLVTGHRSGIDVRVKEGVVRLRGSVDGEREREMLLELVQRADGVVAVEEELTCTPGEPRSGGVRRPRAVRAGAALGVAGGVVAMAAGWWVVMSASWAPFRGEAWDTEVPILGLGWLTAGAVAVLGGAVVRHRLLWGVALQVTGGLWCVAMPLALSLEFAVLPGLAVLLGAGLALLGWSPPVKPPHSAPVPRGARSRRTPAGAGATA